MPNTPLTLDLHHSDDPVYREIAKGLVRQWTILAQAVNASLKIDVDANRSVIPVFDEIFFYASDTGVLWIAVAGVWQRLVGWTGTVTTVTGNYTILSTDSTILADATGGALIVTVPQGASYKGRQWVVKKTDASANTVTVSPSSGTIDGAATKVLSTQYKSLWLESDGTNHFLLAQF